MPKMNITLKRVVFSKVVKNLEKATLFAFLPLLTILPCLLFQSSSIVDNFEIFDIDGSLFFLEGVVQPHQRLFHG